MQEKRTGLGPVSERTILDACGERALPRMGVVEQQWETDPLTPEEVESRAAEAVERLDLDGVPAGGEVAVGAGSRGIANLTDLVGGVVRGLRERGYEPFVFPAMGSHGGATAEGQREVLAERGVTEDGVGCEVRATMEVEKVGETPDRGVPVYADANAAAADGIVPVNRVKPHTDFSGDVESGLSKMLVIGMGKQRGAKTAHEWAVNWSFRRMIPEIASLHLEELPVVGGVAVVEDQHDDTALVEGVPPSGFLDREAELLETAYEHLPTLPFDDLHVLVVDRLGKDVSGSGMDTNVVGRLNFGPEPEPDYPDYDRIFVRSLTEQSHGNAAGLGMADLIHADLLEAYDPEPTLINTLTSSSVRAARVPAAVETDRAGLVAACSTVGVVPDGELRVARVTDTMRLGRFYASEALVEEARKRDGLAVVAEPEELAFDEDGNFADGSPAPVDH
ncbi:MAG: DUF362 domain-containing protein [Halobacteriaceae archaeon]